jgi:type VI secretion system secreted protein Hcp
MRIGFWRAVVAMLAFAVISSFGASDYLLVIDGIPGESLDPKHSGAIVVQSFTWGVTQVSGKPTFSDITFTRVIDKSSPLLFLNSAGGKTLKKATLFVRKASDTPLEYYVIILTDVIITSVQTAASGSGNPNESFSLNFGKVEVNYTPLKADGSLDLAGATRFGWDTRTNVPF